MVSVKLAEVLGAQVGDELRVEILDGKRPVRNVRLAGLAGDFTGMTAYMDMTSLNRLLGEGDIISGANFPGGWRPSGGVSARAQGNPARKLGGDQGVVA